jgi:hypothetical protein
MSVHSLLLIAALILFVLEALSSRMHFKSPVHLLGAGLACLAAAYLV